jgi:folate-dependent phosphoribosylglycinamide formyltransferase PurN
MSDPQRIAVLTVPTEHSWAMINALVARYGTAVHVIAEERQPKRDLIARRMRRQGVLTVIGQIGFVLLQKFIDRRQRTRVREIIRELDLDVAPSASCEVYPVSSVNSMACRAALGMLDPAVVVVMGTRIIGKETLGAITAPVINVHMGWNPAYRGQAGGYWALASGDREHAGITVHLVDEGVDTGDILYRERFQPTKSDSFGTYYYLQCGAAREPLLKAVGDALRSGLKPFKDPGPSRQHYHPTLWGYLWTAFTRSVW